MKQTSIFSLVVRKCTICNSPLNKNQILYCSKSCADKASRQQKHDFINSFKTECSVCGYNRCKSALEFHHLNPDEKEFEISHGSKGRSYESVENEIKKCVLLCANCHAELHAKERELEIYD